MKSFTREYIDYVISGILALIFVALVGWGLGSFLSLLAYGDLDGGSRWLGRHWPWLVPALLFLAVLVWAYFRADAVRFERKLQREEKKLREGKEKVWDEKQRKRQQELDERVSVLEEAVYAIAPETSITELLELYVSHHAHESIHSKPGVFLCGYIWSRVVQMSPEKIVSHGHEMEQFIHRGIYFKPQRFIHAHDLNILFEKMWEVRKTSSQ